MGLNLRRVDFQDWVVTNIPKKKRDPFKKELQSHIGNGIELNFPYDGDDENPRVGSYLSYSIFRGCLVYCTGKDYCDLYGDELDPSEKEAMTFFRDNLPHKSIEIPYVNHFLETGDSDTIFLPIMFNEPFEYEDYFVGSLPRAIISLESFATALNFDLLQLEDEEFDSDDNWNPVATSKNIAKKIYKFFKGKPDITVIYC